MMMLIPDLSQRTLRENYIALAWLYRLLRRPVPRYKCFRCRILVQQRDGPPYSYGRRRPCPKGYANPKRVAPKCPVYPASVYRYIPFDR